MRKKGFTLVEVLVAIAMGTLLLVTLYTIYVVNSKSYRFNINQQELAQNARISLERISRDIRQTYEITTVLPPVSTDPLNPPPNYIQFQDGHNTAQIQYIKYYLETTNLHRQVLHYYISGSPGTWVAWDAVGTKITVITEDAIKADKISLLKFYGVNLVNIELQTTDNDSTFDFRTKVWGRNI